MKNSITWRYKAKGGANVHRGLMGILRPVFFTDHVVFCYPSKSSRLHEFTLNVALLLENDLLSRWKPFWNMMCAYLFHVKLQKTSGVLQYPFFCFSVKNGSP